MLPKITMALGLLSLLCAMAGVLCANRGIIPANAGLALYALSAILGLAAVGCSTAALFLTTRYGAIMVGMLGSLPLVAVLSAGISGMQYPRINDITTDLEHPPHFVEAMNLPANEGRDMSYPDEFVPIVQEHYPEVVPQALNVSADTAYKRAIELARVQFGWTVTHEDPEAHTFEGFSITRTFRWRDDFVVRITPRGDMQCLVDMRSKSRDGKSDLGVNAARIKHFLGELKALDS